MQELDRFRRIPLLDGVTPIQRLFRLEKALTDCPEVPRIYVKRDDFGGLGGGGNKLRKLEYLIADVERYNCDTLITSGSLQSNHARLTAAVAARMGLQCELFLTHVSGHDDFLYRHNGNVLLNNLFGAQVHHLSSQEDANALIEERAVTIRKAGGNAYFLAPGGSSPLGCLGYVACAAEILQQERVVGERFSNIIVPNGSSGTHAGLAAGLALAGDELSRIKSFSAFLSFEETVVATANLLRQTLALTGNRRNVSGDDLSIDGSQFGRGYGQPTAAMRGAVRLIARTEGLLVDPVYGGKALAGLLASIRAGTYRTDEAVLFLMTGGVPSIFAYEPVFSETNASCPESRMPSLVRGDPGPAKEVQRRKSAKNLAHRLH